MTLEVQLQYPHINMLGETKERIEVFPADVFSLICRQAANNLYALKRSRASKTLSQKEEQAFQLAFKLGFGIQDSMSEGQNAPRSR